MSQISGSTALDSSYNDAGLGAITGGGNSELDKEAFLLLLVTQFQYQDPLNPMDDKEFIAQLAQFSALEQSMEMNDKMEMMVTAVNSQTTISITNYIGKEVSGRGYGISKSEGSMSLVQFAAAEPMSSCYVNILDANNSVVATVDLGARAAGIHDFTWDGLTSTGAEAPDGVYSVSFSGKNANGEYTAVDTSVSGRVVGTAYYNGEYYLKLSDGRSLALSLVREVVEAGTYDFGDDEVPVGTTYQGTDKDDFLEGKEGFADTIYAKGGNDVVVYDADDALVDGGDDYDVLIASGDVGDNATNFEAILRGTNATDIKSFDDLKDLGLTLSSDGKSVDVTNEKWLENWSESGTNQWSYTGDDSKLMTLELLTQPEVSEAVAAMNAVTDRAVAGIETAASAVQPLSTTSASTVDFNEALKRGMSGVADTSNSLSNNTTAVLSRLRKAMAS